MRGEGEVGVAAPEVDDPQRVVVRSGVRTWPCSIASVRLASSSRRNSSTWRYFACRRRLHPALRVADPERDQHRVVLGEQPVLGAVVVARDLDGLAPRRGVQQRRRPSWSPGAGGSRRWCRRASWRRAAPTSASTAAAASSPSGWLAVCACVSSYDATCRWRPALRSTTRTSTRCTSRPATTGRRLALAPPARQRAHQPVGVEDGRPEPLHSSPRRRVTARRRGRR